MIEELKQIPVMIFILVMVLCRLIMAVGVGDGSPFVMVSLIYISPLVLGVAMIIWGAGQSRRYFVAAGLAAGNIGLWLGVLGITFFMAHRQGYSEVWEAIPSMVIVVWWVGLTVLFLIIGGVTRLMGR
jgi:hypothetical protein